MSNHRSGKSPAQATNSITVGFGLVSIPMSVYSGTDEGAAVKRSQFTVDGHSIGLQPYDKETGKPYVGEIVKKVQIDPDTAVELTDDEVVAVTGGSKDGLAEIVAFVPASEIGTTYVVTGVKQVRPQRITKGRQHFDNPAAAKAMALLCTAMADASVVGLVKVTLRSAARYAALTPDGRMLILAFANEVRTDLPMPTVEVSDAEQGLAAQLVAAVGISTPVLTDDAGEKLNAYLAAKAEGGETATIVEYQPAPAETSMEALLAMAVAALPKPAELAEAA